MSKCVTWATFRPSAMDAQCKHHDTFSPLTMAVLHLKWSEQLIGFKASLSYQLWWLSQALRGLECGSWFFWVAREMIQKYKWCWHSETGMIPSAFVFGHKWYWEALSVARSHLWLEDSVGSWGRAGHLLLPTILCATKEKAEQFSFLTNK